MPGRQPAIGTATPPNNLTQIANVRDLAAKEKFGWQNTLSSSDGSAFTNEVGRYPPNSFGLYDMHGNVTEWCSDWFSLSYYRESPQADPTGRRPAPCTFCEAEAGTVRRFSAVRHIEPPELRHIAATMSVFASRTSATSPPGRRFSRNPCRRRPARLRRDWSLPSKKSRSAPRKTWAGYAQIEERTSNLAGLTMLLIPPGEFQMGSTPEQIAQVAQFDSKFKSESASHEQPLHRVRISRPFYLSAHEVTRGQFAAVPAGHGI